MILAAIAAIGWSLGQHAAVAIAVTALLLVAIGAQQCRASLGGVIRRKAELHLGSIPLAPGATLIAVVCPDQLAKLPDLIARASVASGALVVLAVEPSKGGRLELPRAAPEMLNSEDSALRAALASALARVGRPVTFMTASGQDVATVTLDVARRIGAREVFALSADDGSADEDARRATSVWQGLPPPKAPLRVRLVVNAREDRSVSLAAASSAR